MNKTAPLQPDEHQSLLQSLQAALQVIESLTPGAELDAKEKADALRQAYQESLYAVNRIGSLWVSARFDAGEFTPEVTAVPTQKLVNEAVEYVRPRAKASEVEVQVKLEGNTSIRGDWELLHSMLVNLLASTVGVSRRGTHLLISSFLRGDDVVIKLEDQGDGITRRLFPALVSGQVEGGEGTHGKPLDIGTLTTKPIIDAHHGRLWVERQGESGGALFIALPALDSAEAATPSGDKKVLIVDDDPDGTFMLEQVLAKGGYATETARDGLSGLHKAKAADIGLVLLDVMLPGMDGFEVCRRLRSDPATADLPILMVSAKSRPEDREIGLKMGADGYMTKPLRLAEVLEKTTELLNKPRQVTHE